MTSHKNKDETERCVEDRVYGAVNILVFLTVILHIAVCPYTKVEESFNLQAIHDILNHGTDLEAYDHHTFPRVVPRTFLAPCLVSFLSWPLTTLSRLTGLSKFCQQYIARGVLGVLVVWAFSVYRSAVRERFGLTVSLFLSLMTLSQFHFLFYSSRPLPNTMALVPVLLSLSLNELYCRLSKSTAYSTSNIYFHFLHLLGPYQNRTTISLALSHMI